MTMDKDFCEHETKDLGKIVKVSKEYCKKNNISINKVPMTGRTIYITKFPDDNTEQEN